MCNTIYTVANAPATAADVPVAEAGAEQWRMRAPEGQTYGPVSKKDLDGWISEGRVTADCELHCEGTGLWQGAAEVYPVLRPQPQSATRSQSESATATRRYRHIEPHRGILILVLGILSWISCPIFGIVAWVLGNNDLREIRAGRMDPSGRGLTQAGQILGMVLVIILMCAMILGVFVLLASLAVGQM